MQAYLLSVLIFIPALGAILVMLTPRHRQDLIKWLALVITLLALAVSWPLYFNFADNVVGYQFEHVLPWIPALNINYHVGLDGLSLFLVLLTTFLSAVAILSSWTAIAERVKEYYALMLLLETAMLGVFVSLDLFLFYIFWEASLIPMALLVGIWGGQRRIYASVKFIIYTMSGSALMLAAALVLYFREGTSDLPALVAGLNLPESWQVWLFFTFALAFAVKVPLFPFHTWLPAAHVEAPTAGSIILAGVLLKMGAYGFMRFAIPLFPAAVPFWTPWLATLAVISILYGAMVALAQEDAKSLVAYSSVAHMGFIVLGIFSGGQQGLSGAVLQMVNHGLSTGMLFFMIGVLYEQRHTRLFKDYGGIWVKVPVFGVFFLLAVFSSVGLPGLNGFVGEFVILLGTFKVNWVAAAFGTFGIVLAAWYLLTAARKLLYGPFNPANDGLRDMNGREMLIAVSLVVFFFVIGLFPHIFFGKINPATARLDTLLKAASTLAGW
ncbi:MAG: NADH-quinone oxidoreductase subunit M [Anaerolineae bacterium]|nr:NADH-quinone oxidoreductase subunit M [Anaerolineae bacterium]